MTDRNPKALVKLLNVNELINQIKIQRFLEWTKNKMLLYAVYRRHTDLKIQIFLKKSGVIYIMQL